MGNYEVRDMLAVLFKDAGSIISELSANSADGSFTSQQFLKRAAQQNQEAYIELLTRCLKHPSASPFNAAHQHIGGHLSSVAQKLGYSKPENCGRTEIDIFGNSTDRIVYRRLK